MRKRGAGIEAPASGHLGALIVLALLLAVHLAALWSLGPEYTLNSDDLSYIKSGIRFAQTGTITMHTEYPSAQIMPGMTVLIAAVYRLVGDGAALWIVLKCL